MSEWNSYSLNKICASPITYGVVKPGNEDIHGVKFIRGGDISNGQIQINNLRTISLEKSNEYQRTLLRGGEILISLVGNPGEVAIVPEKLKNANIARQVGLLRISENIDTPFVKYYLMSSVGRKELYACIGGSVQQVINLKDLKTVSVNLPPLPEQKAIASVLSSLDDKIDLLHHQNKTLESMAETLFRQWFVEEADESWPISKLGDFITTNQSSLSNKADIGLIDYLDTGSLTCGKIDRLQNIDFSEAPSRARRLVKHNDILISTVRPNQRHYGIIKNPSSNLIVSTGFCVITCNEIDPHFVYLLLTQDDMTEYLHSIAEGSTSTYPSLKPSDIETLDLILPPKDKMNAFASISSDIWEKIEYNYSQIITLQSLRDTLLPKLMSGEVRVDYT